MVTVSNPQPRFNETGKVVIVTLPDAPCPSSFVSIDFETATLDQLACQMGIVGVEDGQITFRRSYLFRPPGNRYDWQCSKIHSLTARDTENAPEFPAYWPEIYGLLSEKCVVCHNAAFDIDVLEKTMDHYGLGDIQLEDVIDTCDELGQSTLFSACSFFGIPINRLHDALSDAEAAALLLLEYSKHPGETVSIPRLRAKSRTAISAENRKPKSDAAPSVFNGKKVVISGIFSDFPFRDDLAAKLSGLGARVTSSVSSKTDILITGEEAGESKIRKAQELGIRIMEESELYEALK